MCSRIVFFIRIYSLCCVGFYCLRRAACFRGEDLETTQKERRSVVCRSALFVHPPHSYLSAGSVNSGEAKEKEHERNQPRREKRINRRCRPPTLEGIASTRRQRLMWEAACAYSEKQRRGAACVCAWAAEQQPALRWQRELASRKRGPSKSKRNLVWGVWRDGRMAFWRNRRNFTPPASRLVKKAVGYN